MTPSATFITNGVERVVVTYTEVQEYFWSRQRQTHASGKLLFNCRIIQEEVLVDFEFDPKDILYFRIDRKKKLPISTLLFALGFSKDKIIFYSTNKYSYNKDKKSWITDFNLEIIKDLLNYHMI